MKLDREGKNRALACPSLSVARVSFDTNKIGSNLFAGSHRVGLDSEKGQT